MPDMGWEGYTIGQAEHARCAGLILPCPAPGTSHLSQEDLISKLKVFIVIGLAIVLKPHISQGFSRTQG